MGNMIRNILWRLTFFFFDKQEGIICIYKKAKQSTHNVYIVAKRNRQAKERDKKQKTNLLCLLWANPIYKAYQVKN